MKVYKVQSSDQIINWYKTSFEEFERSLNGEKSTSLHALRRSAIAKFVEIGFPTTREEEWRFTNITPITKINFHPILQYDCAGLTLRDIGRFALDGVIRLTFVDGFFSPELSDIRSLSNGIVTTGLASALKKDAQSVQQLLNKYLKLDENAFMALNTAFIQDGAFVSIPNDTVVDLPIQLLYISTNQKSALFSHPRNLILVGENAHLSLIETYGNISENICMTSVVTEMELGIGAIVEHNKLQIENSNSFHVGTTFIHQDKGSKYTSNSIVIGGSIVRNNHIIQLDAEGIECTLNGLSLATDTQLIDNHTVIDHAKPHCESHELFKSILDGKSRGVFNGKIYVRKDAQKTDAKQTNKTLLLSDDATINTKPQLEIFADDVKCTHGATVGQLDEEQVFYLRSRGIDEKAARDILIFAFASDIINRIGTEQLRKMLEKIVQMRLNRNRSLN